MEMDNIKRQFITLIDRTGDPFAPITLQNAHGAVEKLSKLMARQAKPETVAAYNEQMLAQMPMDMDHIARDPSFIMALAGMLTSAIETYRDSL